MGAGPSSRNYQPRDPGSAGRQWERYAHDSILDNGPAPFDMKTDYVPQVNGVLGLTQAESADYLMIGLHSPAGRLNVSQYLAEREPQTVWVEVEGGAMKRSPYTDE